MKHIASALILTIVIGLAGCATPGGRISGSPSNLDQQRMAVLTQAVLKRGGSVSELFFLEVPSASDAIADYLSVGLIKAGTSSSTMDALLTLLQKAPGAQVVVFGDSDAVTAASVQGVFKNLRISPDHSKTILWVALKNPSIHAEGLRAAAQTAAVRLEILQTL